MKMEDSTCCLAVVSWEGAKEGEQKEIKSYLCQLLDGHLGLMEEGRQKGFCLKMK